MGINSGFVSKRQDRSNKKSVPDRASSGFDHRSNRRRDLARSVRATEILWNAGITDPINARTCPRIYTIIRVELAFLNGEPDALANDRIGEIAALFGIDPAFVRVWWHTAAVEATEGDAECKKAAHKRIEEYKPAVVGHRRLIDLREASIAFEKTPERDKALFAKRAGRQRIYTGLPTLPPDYSYASVIPAGPGTDRLTTAERKALAAEIGVTTERVRVQERDRSVEEFDHWVEWHRRRKANREKREAEQKARAGRRKRKPGKTAAIRDFALHSGRSESWAWRQCRGLSPEEITVRTPRQILQEITVTDGRIHPARESDCVTEAESEVSRSVSRFSANDSDSDSDKDAEIPAFSGKFTTDNAENAKRVTVARKGPARPAKRPKIPAYKRAVLTAWYREAKGSSLAASTIRQWRRRGVFDARFDEAADWYCRTYPDVVSDIAPIDLTFSGNFALVPPVTMLDDADLPF